MIQPFSRSARSLFVSPFAGDVEFGAAVFMI